MKKLLIVFILFCHNLNAQELKSTQQNMQVEELAERNIDETDLYLLEEQRLNLLKNPINLNEANFDQLIKSNLFNEFEAKEIITHRNKYGRYLCIEELQQIDVISISKIREISAYVNTNGPLFDERFSFVKLLKELRKEVIIRFQKPLEKQEAYISDSLNNTYYIGNNNRTYMRLKANAGNYFSIGITGEKDAGEKFELTNKKYGFDFISFHAYIKPNTKIKSIALGDYRVQFGQGLVTWSGISFGKSGEIFTVKRNALGIRPYTSAAETGFCRGVAICFQPKKIQYDVWYSKVPIDASINGYDTSYISYISEAGLHRNQNEIEKRSNAWKQDIGIHVKWENESSRIEITSQLTNFSSDIEKNNAPYNQFEYSGNNFMSAGVAYSKSIYNINFFGETALDKQGNIATLNGLLIMPDSKISIAILHRFYPRSYNNPNADAFRESSKMQNEKGTYFGLTWNIKRTLKLSCFVDYYKFDWLKYGVDAPSNGKEILVQFLSNPSRTSEFMLRFRAKETMQDDAQHIDKIDDQKIETRYNFRANAKWKLTNGFSLQTRLEINSMDFFQTSMASSLIAQDIIFKPMGKPWSFTTRIAIFNAPDYDSRIFAYEQNVQGVGGISSFYNTGLRYYLMTKQRITKNMNLWIRYSKTIYSNIESIGSGKDELAGNSRSNIYLQLSYSF